MAKKTAPEQALGFEAELWQAANQLRGNMDAAEYKHVILGLVFLKYVSDTFEKQREKIIAEGGDPEDLDEYLADGVFFIPENARWNRISLKAHSPEIGVAIDEAMRAIEKSNDRLKGILPKNFARPELDKTRLGNVVDIFSNIRMTEKGDAKDVLGRTYEYCLMQFASQEGKKAGEFYTPACIVRTLVEVLKPNGRVYDPCCGSGGMFVQSARFIQMHRGNIQSISVYGQESNPTTRKLALMNLAIHGIEGDLGTSNADTFLHDLHPVMRADFILANPPFNVKEWGGKNLQDDKRWKYGTPPEGNANYAWIQQMIWHLAPKGRIGLVLANGALSSTTESEGEIRRKIIEDDLVESIVSLPTQLFYSTQIPASLWFLNRAKPQKGKTLFIDARKMGEMVTRKDRVLTETDIARIAETFDNFQKGKQKDVLGFCAVADLKQIADQNYILTPGRYVGIEETEEEDEPFEEKFARLTGELDELFKKGRELEKEIRKQLGKIG